MIGPAQEISVIPARMYNEGLNLSNFTLGIMRKGELGSGLFTE